jgi:hypothetical protein
MSLGLLDAGGALIDRSRRDDPDGDLLGRLGLEEQREVRPA